MKDQELFDFVVESLLNQGCKSVDEDGDCLYRGLNGCKCAIGHLLTDEDLREYKIIEGYSVSEPEVTQALTDKGMSVDLCSYLQSAHDNCRLDFIPTFKQRARDIATQFNLEWRFEDWS